MIPSLARASSLGLFFFRKLWGGFLKEGRGHKFTGWLSGERLAPPPTPSFPLPSPPPFPWHLAGCTGTGTGPGRLWYMRMMLRISLLGSARQGSGSELRSTALPPAGLCPPPAYAPRQAPPPWLAQSRPPVQLWLHLATVVASLPQGEAEVRVLPRKRGKM